MTGKGIRRGSYQGRGVQWVRGIGRDSRGYRYYGATPKHKGLYSALRKNVFDYGQKASADQMITTWEKIVHHVGTIHGYNISNELLNNKTIIITKP